MAKKKNGNRAMVASVPRSLRPMSVPIHHEEPMQILSGDTSYFTAVGAPINPGISSVQGGQWKWLAKVAANFERYMIHKIIVRFKSRKGTDTDGMVYMTWQPSVLDPEPQDAATLMRNQYSCEGQTHKNLALVIPSSKELFIRTGPYNNSADPRNSDHGKLFVSVDGQPDISQIGRLMFEYHLSLAYPTGN